MKIIISCFSDYNSIIDINNEKPEEFEDAGIVG